MSKANEKKEVIERITRWINEEHYLIRMQTYKDRYADFHAAVQYNRYKVSIIIRKDRKDMVSIVSRQNFSDQDKKIFSHLREEKKKPFFEDLEFSLLPMNISYSVHPDRNKMEYVHLEKSIYFDGLTKDRFYDSIFAVVRALHMTSLLYIKYLSSGSRASSPIFIQ